MISSEKIIEMIASHLQVSEKNITLDSNLFDDLGADSMDSIELVLILEREFDIEISDEQIDSLQTVKDVIDLVSSLS